MTLLLLLACGSTPSEAPSADAPPTAVAPTAKPADVIAFTNLNAASAAELLTSRPEVVVLDVRTPDEFAGGHLKGAINHDFTSPGFADAVATLDKGTPYLVHCASGRRSQSAMKVLVGGEFAQLYHLDGGIQAWQAAGQPVEP